MLASSSDADLPPLAAAGPHQLPSISDFEIVKHVSSGAFGDVFLAKRRTGQENDQSQLFAVKRVSKKTLVTKNLIDQIQCERAALAISRCRHVVHLYYSLQTDTHVYLVMEYLCGGDLRSMLLAVGCLSQEAAVVYTAEVATALEYLHSHGIIHRDIKPDNMLVSANGHIKLTDFGLSQVSVRRVTQQQLMFGNSTPGGYQASAEKRYPRTPRQLMSLAADFSFGSAGGGGGGCVVGSGSCSRLARRRRQARYLASAAAGVSNRGSVGHPSRRFAILFSSEDGEQGNKSGSKKSPLELFIESNNRIEKDNSKNSLEVTPEVSIEEALTAASGSEEVSATAAAVTDHVTRVRFKSGPVASTSAASPPLSADELHCDPLSSQLSSGQSVQQQYQRLLGTPDYLAPELVQGLPHGTPVDYWALGVCLFEFLTGCPPFAGDSPEQVMENIVNRQIPWPEAGSRIDGEEDELSEPELSAEAVSAIDGLLSYEPASRLDINDLRRHPLFGGISWERLHSSEAPFVPDLGGDCQDTSYFELANRREPRCKCTNGPERFCYCQSSVEQIDGIDVRNWLCIFEEFANDAKWNDATVASKRTQRPAADGLAGGAGWARQLVAAVGAVGAKSVAGPGEDRLDRLEKRMEELIARVGVQSGIDTRRRLQQGRGDCFNCGQPGHRAAQCQQREKQPEPDHLPQANSKPCRWLLDTGAQTSLISDFALRELHGRCKLKPTDVMPVSVDSFALELLGSMSIAVRLGRQLRRQMHVLVGAVVVPPKSVKVADVTTETKQTQGIFEPSQEFIDKIGVLPYRVFAVSSASGKIPVQECNLSCSPVTLFSNQSIGTFESAEVIDKDEDVHDWRGPVDQFNINPELPEEDRQGC
uniref:Serine/threonine-protein kinase greatwall n=1 Tax=Macrostomum lignano TaxID=282301 RepID=A0A1I8HPY7_9PLAT